MNTPHLVPHTSLVSPADRERLHGHGAALLWFTGLSGSGKSTLAHGLEKRLHDLGIHTYVLDGDNVRHGLCRDLGFSLPDRQENIRRIGEVGKLFVDAGCVVLSAFISPLAADRDRVRALFSPGQFLEIYCSAPLSVCEQRDVKGLYQQARAGTLANFTGISSPYEAPTQADMVVNTAEHSIEHCLAMVLDQLQCRGLIPPQNVCPPSSAV